MSLLNRPAATHYLKESLRMIRQGMRKCVQNNVKQLNTKGRYILQFLLSLYSLREKKKDHLIVSQPLVPRVQDFSTRVFRLVILCVNGQQLV